MTPHQIRRARNLLDELERHDLSPKVYSLIREIRSLLEPVPSLKEIFDMVPGDTIEGKAAKVGITRSAYYKIINGQVRPQNETVRLLSAVSGISIEKIRLAQP